MKNFRVLIFSLLLFSFFESFCQSGQEVEMADVLRQEGKIYTVVTGLVVILTGLIAFLIRVDRKMFRLEKAMKNNK